jgi:hypothetical protein
MTTTSTVIARTNKGHRVWIQGVFAATGRTIGQRYDVNYSSDSIHIVFSTIGKRKVTAAKGGIIDLEGKKVTQFSQGATQVTVDTTPSQIIIIRRV